MIERSGAYSIREAFSLSSFQDLIPFIPLFAVIKAKGRAILIGREKGS